MQPPVFLSTSHGVDRVHVRLKKFGDELNKGKEKLGQDLLQTVEEARKITDNIKDNIKTNLGSFGNLGRIFNQGAGEGGCEGEEGTQVGPDGEGDENGAALSDGEADVYLKVHAGGRIDYVLQESTMEVGQAQSYISAIAAHCIYFESPDVVRSVRLLTPINWATLPPTPLNTHINTPESQLP